MSKYKRIKTKLTDRDALLAALEACDLPYEVAPRATNLALHDWHGRRAGSAEIMVRRDVLDARTGKVGNDMGFTWDEFEQCYEVSVTVEHEPVLNQIRQQYAVQQVTGLAEAQGYVVQPIETEGGVMRLQLVQY